MKDIVMIIANTTNLKTEMIGEYQWDNKCIIRNQFITLTNLGNF